MTHIRVGIVDDDGPYARSLEDILGLEPDVEVVGVGGTGVEAVVMAREARPDVLLLDLGMPVMGGLEALRHIKPERPDIAVLVLTVQDDDESLFEALKAGATGYLLKTSPPEEIVAAVRSLACGQGVLPPALAGRVVAEFQRLAALPQSLAHLFCRLSRKEAEVLTLICERWTNRAIAEKLEIKEKTVKIHVTSILKSLEVNNRAEAALIAQRSGLPNSPDCRKGRPDRRESAVPHHDH